MQILAAGDYDEDDSEDDSDESGDKKPTITKKADECDSKQAGATTGWFEPPVRSVSVSTIAGRFAADLLQMERLATIASIDDCRLVSRRKDMLMATFAGMRHSIRFGRGVF
jgi:hypothetical protein